MAEAVGDKHHNFACRCDVAISQWATGGRRSDLFYRSIARGAIVNPWDEPFVQRFHLEFSHLGDLQWASMIHGTGGPILEIWDRTAGEAAKLCREPLIVVKQTRYPEMVMSSATTFEALWRSSRGRLQVQVMFARDGIVVHVFFLRQLLTRCDPKLLMAQRSTAA